MAAHRSPATAHVAGGAAGAAAGGLAGAVLLAVASGEQAPYASWNTHMVSHIIHV